MTPNAEFLFRLPSSAAIGLATRSDATLRKPTTRCLFSFSTLELVRSLDTFEQDGTLEPTQVGENGKTGTMAEIVEWVKTSKPRHWAAVIRKPDAPGSLWCLHWLRAVCSDMFLGGQVNDQGRWCLYLRGTVHERCQADPESAIDREAVGEHEYLNIAVAEGTAMLLQLYTERKWNT